MGGFLWNCDNDPDYKNFIAAAATYSDDQGWTVLNGHTDSLNSRVNALSNTGVAVGWAAKPTGWWEGRVWKDGQEINLQDAAPAGTQYVGEATAVSTNGEWVVGINTYDENFDRYPFRYEVGTGAFEIIEISEPCPLWDWFCFGSQPFNPYDIADDGTLVGALGSASGSQAMIVSETLGGELKLVDFLRGQGVINAADLSIVSNAVKVSSNGRHIVGWTAVDGYFGSFKITLDQLYVCQDGKSQRVGYPGAVASHLANGATLGLCEADLPLQYR